MQPPKTQLADPRQVAFGEQLIRPIQADVVALPAAPDAALVRLAVMLLAEIRLAPVFGNAIGVVVAIVRDHLIAERLAVPDRFPQLRLAAQRRLDRQNLRIAAVVAAAVPADQAELGVRDALPVKLVEDVAHASEVAEHPHRRLRLRRLLLDLVRHRLHAEPYPHLQRARRIRQFRGRGRTLAQRTKAAPREVVLPVPLAHAQPIRVACGQETVFHRQSFRQTRLVAERPQRECRVDRVLVLRSPVDADAKPRVELAAGDDARHGAVAAHHAEQRHRALAGTLVDRHPVLAWLLLAEMTDRARLLRDHQVSRVAFACRAEPRQQPQRLQPRWPAFHHLPGRHADGQHIAGRCKIQRDGEAERLLAAHQAASVLGGSPFQLPATGRVQRLRPFGAGRVPIADFGERFAAPDHLVLRTPDTQPTRVRLNVPLQARPGLSPSRSRRQTECRRQR